MVGRAGEGGRGFPSHSVSLGAIFCLNVGILCTMLSVFGFICSFYSVAAESL